MGYLERWFTTRKSVNSLNYLHDHLQRGDPLHDRGHHDHLVLLGGDGAIAAGGPVLFQDTFLPPPPTAPTEALESLPDGRVTEEVEGRAQGRVTQLPQYRHLKGKSESDCTAGFECQAPFTVNRLLTDNSLWASCQKPILPFFTSVDLG